MEAFGNFDDQPVQQDGFNNGAGLNFDNNEGGGDIFAAADGGIGMSNQGTGF